MANPPPVASSSRSSSTPGRSSHGATTSRAMFAARDNDRIRDRLPVAGSTTAKALTGLARLGYAVRGLVYVLIGGLALAAALPVWSGGSGGAQQAQGSRGAIASLTDEPWGEVLLVVIGIGLFGYALWRFVQSIMDTDAHGTDAKGIAVRIGLLVSAVSHTLLGIFTLSLVFGWTFGLGGGGGGGGGGAGSGGGAGAGAGAGGSSASSSSGTTSITAEIMALPAGRWLVGMVGAAVIGAGIAQFVKAYKAGFRKRLDLPERTMQKVSPICRFGLAARGVSFMLIGFFIVMAAWNANPSQSRGLGGAIESLRDEPYGVWLMALVALGLLAFAAYSFIEAWARRIATRKVERAMPG